MSASSIPADFDVSGVGLANGNLYGLPHTADQAQAVILPVPWATTVSYREGTEGAAEAVLEASLQVDLYDADFPDGWQKGVHLLPVDEAWRSRGAMLRPGARNHIQNLVDGGEGLPEVVADVNRASAELNAWVYSTAAEWLSRGKRVGVLGGEHSVPLGLMQAVAAHYGPIGILQLDAHADLRPAYEGFQYSHASIMYNALREVDGLTRLVQVGIRDMGHNEVAEAERDRRVRMHTMQQLRRAHFRGESWDSICRGIVNELPDLVFISFDIDALDPSLCPGTGTPVPDGLKYEEALHIIHLVHATGRKVVGFDLNEVGSDEWDATVGARVLLKLINLLNAW